MPKFVLNLIGIAFIIIVLMVLGPYILVGLGALIVLGIIYEYFKKRLKDVFKD